MAIIYSYPDNENLLLTDMLIGTSTIIVNGRKKNITKNFTLESLGMFISENFPAANIAWGDITGNLSNQTDLQNALNAKQANITLTTTGTSGLATFIGSTLNIPDYGSGYITPTLQSVTDEGNTTTTDIIVDSALYESIISNNYITVTTKGTLSGIGLLSSGAVSFGNGSVYSYLSSDVTNLNVYFRLPNKLAGTYTLATTADIPVVTGFVPYTGATGNVNLGDYNYIGGNLELNGISTDGGSINLRQSASSTISGDGYTSIYSLGTDSVSFYLANNFDGKQFNLLTNGITLNDTLDYTLPSTSGTIALISDIPASVTSVGLTMPSAFSVANSPITNSGTLAVTGAGVASQYIRGDGSLANFPTSTGGGASVSYYLNGSISQGAIGGVAYKEINSVPVIGAGTDFTINADGYIAQFITDAGDPNKLLIPSGNWNFETYFSASSGGGSPRFYIELYKYNGVTFTLIASNSATPENITGGTSIDLYFTALAVPPTTLLVTDRLAVRFYVIHSGRTITMHTENSHLSQIITTFSSGLTALNGLTSQVQYFGVGTSGTDFAISSSGDTHTFNLPTASAANRGALSSTDWTTFNGKFTLPALTSGSVLFSNGTTIAQKNASFFWDDTNNRLGIGTNAPSRTLELVSTSLSNLLIRNGSVNMITNETNGIGASDFRFRIWNNGNTNTLDLYGTGDYDHQSKHAFRIGGTERMRIAQTTGNVLINTTTDAGYKLDVNGTARVQGTSIFTADATINGHTVGRGGGDVSTNVVVGSAISNNTGLNGTFLGNLAGGNNTSGSRNTYIGYTSGFNQTTGNNNVFAGERAGRYIADGATSNTIANDSIFIGQNTKPLANNQTNQIVIGYNAIGAGSNTATLGNTSIIDTILRGRINLQQYATGSRPTYVKGALIYDSTLGKLVVGGATGWEVVTSI